MPCDLCEEMWACAASTIVYITVSPYRTLQGANKCKKQIGGCVRACMLIYMRARARAHGREAAHAHVH